MTWKTAVGTFQLASAVTDRNEQESVTRRFDLRRTMTLMVILMLVLAACGGDDGEADDIGADDIGTVDAGDSESGGEVSGDVVDPQPPGQAMASVDGQDFTFDTPGLTDCTISEESITYSFVIGDNEVGLAGGANLYDDGWLGDITLRVVGADGLPVQYFPNPGSLGDGIAISGDSMSYSGPMMMQPPNDGSNPPPVDVGEGTISVTCG